MPYYFMRDTPLQALEQLMMSQPGQKPRGGGIYRSPFHYTPKDVACEYCQNYVRKHPCRLCECTCLDERIEAGVLEVNEFVRECFAPSMGPQFRIRMHQQLRERNPQFFLSDAHRRRWTHWRERCWRLSDRNKAALYLLTAYESLWRRMVWKCGNDGFDFQSVRLGGIEPELYSVYQAAKAIAVGCCNINLFCCVKNRPLALLAELGFLPLNTRDDFNVLYKFLSKGEITDDYLQEEMELTEILLKPPEAEAIRTLLLERAPRGDVRRAADFFKLVRYSFSGSSKSFGGKPCDIRRFFHLIWECSRRLANVIVENKDFEDVIRQYLKKPLKQLVDTIVDALAELPEVSECYEVWNQIHEELNECYGHSTPWERLPLSQRKEFRKIKNDIIREAENIRLGLPTFEDERMQDEPELESQKEEHRSYSVYEQAQQYRTAKAVLQDIHALDAEHADAVKALEQLWEEGYTVAAHQLGKFYRDDLSTLRDHAKAEQWFRRSAEAGNDFSEYALGKLLLTQKRTVEALGWLDKAAEHGNQFARYQFGKIYLTGESVQKDVEKALAYLTASADQGNQFAQYTLGKLYLLGRDVPPDREQAKEWLIRAAAQGNEYARFFLDRFDQFRDPSVMLAATKLLHHMSKIFQSNSVPPGNPAGIRIDSKRRRRLMKKRMAMGHKADDHEEQTQYQQSM